MTLRDRAAHWLREPLVHFLIAGALIFLFFAWRGPVIDVGDRRIVVNEAQVQRLATIWSQTWQRPPSATELDGLIRDTIKEEIYYREALRLGLDKDDAIIRRRLRSKMEFLATSETDNTLPTDIVLQAWLDTHSARYATDPLISFDQVYVRATDGDSATARAKNLLVRLRAHAKAATLGDPISLPPTMQAASKSDISREFGDEFTAALSDFPVGEWRGPIASGFGLHLVRVRAVTASRHPKLSHVRQTVENDWRAATRERRENQAYQVLLDGYKVEIERPK